MLPPCSLLLFQSSPPLGAGSNNVVTFWFCKLLYIAGVSLVSILSKLGAGSNHVVPGDSHIVLFQSSPELGAGSSLSSTRESSILEVSILSRLGAGSNENQAKGLNKQLQHFNLSQTLGAGSNFDARYAMHGDQVSILSRARCWEQHVGLAGFCI